MYIKGYMYIYIYIDKRREGQTDRQMSRKERQE